MQLVYHHSAHANSHSSIIGKRSEVILTDEGAWYEGREQQSRPLVLKSRRAGADELRSLPVFLRLHLERVLQPVQQFVSELAYILLLTHTHTDARTQNHFYNAVKDIRHDSCKHRQNHSNASALITTNLLYVLIYTSTLNYSTHETSVVWYKLHSQNPAAVKQTCCDSLDLKASLRISTALDGSTYFLLDPTIREKRFLSSCMKGRFLCSWQHKRENAMTKMFHIMVYRFFFITYT